MATSMERRLERIESRLEALEGARDVLPAPGSPARELPLRAFLQPPQGPLVDVGGATEESPLAREKPPGQAHPRTSSKSTPEQLPQSAPQPVPTPREKVPVDWERFFGLAVLGRVGVAAVLLAAGYFAKLAYDTMSDGLKVLSIYALSGVFFSAGWFLRERVARRYLAMLWGGAAAAAYLAGLAACLRYGLVSGLGGLAMLLAASVFGQALARRLRHVALANIALAGAFAAPLLVVFPLGERVLRIDPTFLLVYVLALHAWSAWVERTWSWSSARLIGVIGTIVVVCVWVRHAGGVDLSTYGHLHVYLLGLILPELVAALTGRAVSEERQFLIPVGLAVTEACLLMAAGGPIQVFALPAFTTLAGAAWLLMALGLGFTRARPKIPNLVRGLGQLGGVMLAFGLLHFSPAILGGGTAAQAVWTVIGLGVLCGGLLALRPRLKAGEIGAALAACAAVITALQPTDTALALKLVALALPAAAALVLTGHAVQTRAMGVWLGFLALGVGVMRADQYHVAWQAGALIACALWLAGVMAWGRRRTQIDLEQQGMAGLWLLGGLWMLFAFAGRLKDADLALANPATAAAIVIAAVAAWGALTHRARWRGRKVLVAGLWVLCIGILLLVGHRETAEAVEGLAKPIRDALHLVYLSVAALCLAFIGRARGVRALGRTASALALGAVCKAVLNGTAPALGAWAMLELLAPVGALLLIVRWDRRGDALLPVAAAAGLVSACLGWGLYALEERLPAELVLMNVRFLTGLILLGACYALPLCSFSEVRRRSIGLVLLGVGVLTGYVVGLAELLQAAEPLAGHGAWPAILVSLFTTLFAAGLLVAGFLRRVPHLRYAGLLGFGIVILKIGLIDLAAAALPLRILVTGVLGLVLLAAAFAYARRSGLRGAPRGEEGLSKA